MEIMTTLVVTEGHERGSENKIKKILINKIFRKQKKGVLIINRFDLPY
jgi:hypothetical protein